jgi:hypothetical protein
MGSIVLPRVARDLIGLKHRGNEGPREKFKR